MAYKTYNNMLPAEVADIMKKYTLPIDYITYSSIMIDYNHAAKEGQEQLSEYLESLEKGASAAAKHLDNMAAQTGSEDWMTWPFILDASERPRGVLGFWTRNFLRVEIPGVDDTNAYKLRFKFEALQTQQPHAVARPGTPYNRLDIPVWMAEQIPADTEAAQEDGFLLYYVADDTDVWETLTAYEVIGIYIIQRFLLDQGRCYSTMHDIFPMKKFISSRGPGCIVYP